LSAIETLLYCRVLLKFLVQLPVLLGVVLFDQLAETDGAAASEVVGICFPRRRFSGIREGGLFRFAADSHAPEVAATPGCGQLAKVLGIVRIGGIGSAQVALSGGLRFFLGVLDDSVSLAIAVKTACVDSLGSAPRED
jgi:hypothetical protein